MKKVGLIGGLSWHSTVTYYEHINRIVNQTLSTYATPEIVLASVNFQEIVDALNSQRWDRIENVLLHAAQTLQQAGVDFFLSCCNTVHKVAPLLQAQVALPFLHILEPVGKQLQQAGMHTVALLGTRFTMQESFHKAYLKTHFNIDVVTPTANSVATIDRIIFSELCHGRVTEASQCAVHQEIIQFKEQGAQAVLLGCTELNFLFERTLPMIPVFDTTLIHATAAAMLAMEQPALPIHTIEYSAQHMGLGR